MVIGTHHPHHPQVDLRSATDIACTVGRGVYPAMQEDKAIGAMKKEGTHDVGVENDLLHYMCVIREQEVDAVLKIVIKI